MVHRFGRADRLGHPVESVKAARLQADRRETVRRLEPLQARERRVLALERRGIRRPQLGEARTRREPRPESELREYLVFQSVQE